MQNKGDVNDMMYAIPDAVRIRCVAVETAVAKREEDLSLARFGSSSGRRR
jgi:hypothetical protein